MQPKYLDRYKVDGIDLLVCERLFLLSDIVSFSFSLFSEILKCANFQVLLID